jgi:hypothetical protein
MTSLKARNLTLEEVHQLLGYRRQYGHRFEDFLVLAPLSEQEQQELARIRDDFEPYLDTKPLESVVKAMTVFPLLRLAGFYSPPIRLRIEEGIDEINIDTEDTKISGRFDIVAVNLERRSREQAAFWILVIEAKEGMAGVWAGLPQLLAYAFPSLEAQGSVWGLVTTGLDYQFMQLTAQPPTYQLLPRLTLLEAGDLFQLLQVLKGIRQARFA